MGSRIRDNCECGGVCIHFKSSMVNHACIFLLCVHPICVYAYLPIQSCVHAFQNERSLFECVSLVLHWINVSLPPVPISIWGLLTLPLRRHIMVHLGFSSRHYQRVQRQWARLYFHKTGTLRPSYTYITPFVSETSHVGLVYTPMCTDAHIIEDSDEKTHKMYWDSPIYIQYESIQTDMTAIMGPSVQPICDWHW